MENATNRNNPSVVNNNVDSPGVWNFQRVRGPGIYRTYTVDWQ